MDVYFSDQVNDPSLRLFSSTKRFDTDTFDDKNFDEELQAVLAAANINASMSSVLSNLGLGIGLGNRMNCLKRDSVMPPSNPANMLDYDLEEKQDEEDESKPDVSINLSTKLLSTMNSSSHSTNDKNNNKSHLPSLNSTNNKNSESHAEKDGNMNEPNNNTMNQNRNLMGSNSSYSVNSEASSRNSANSHPNSNINNNNNDEDYEDNMVRSYERNLKNLNQKFLHEMNEHHNIDQYLLSWRGFHGNMCKGFHTLQRDGQMVDVTIAAGGKIFKAHKLVQKLSQCQALF